MLEGASHNVSTDKAYELEKQPKVKNATKCTRHQREEVVTSLCRGGKISVWQQTEFLCCVRLQCCTLASGCVKLERFMSQTMDKRLTKKHDARAKL